MGGENQAPVDAPSEPPKMTHALFRRKNRQIWSFSLLTPSRNRRTHLVLPPQSGSRHGGAKVENMRSAARHAVVAGEPRSGQIQPLLSLRCSRRPSAPAVGQPLAPLASPPRGGSHPPQPAPPSAPTAFRTHRPPPPTAGGAPCPSARVAPPLEKRGLEKRERGELERTGEEREREK